MAETSLNMWRAAPIFGIGVGRFYDQSSHFGAEALRRELGFVTMNENAHNYFLQVFSTEGIVGLAALLIVLGVVFVPALEPGAAAFTPLRPWLVAGLVGYVLTWLTGHPQLVPEASFAFWLTFGVLAGLTAPPRAAGWRGFLAIAAAIVLLTAPVRAAHALRQAELEHVALGLSHWQPEIDGVRYRIAGSSFELYLPGDGTAVDLPLRRSPVASDPLAVAIRVNGQKLYEPLVSGDAWQQIRLQLPKTNRRFVLVQFEVSPSQPDGTPVLFVGRAKRR
jgi:O-Antigen ligase